jgi:hypothetical protein
MDGGILMLQLQAFIVYIIQEPCFVLVQKLLVDIFRLGVLAQLKTNGSETLACL